AVLRSITLSLPRSGSEVIEAGGALPNRSENGSQKLAIGASSGNMWTGIKSPPAHPTGDRFPRPCFMEVRMTPRIGCLLALAGAGLLSLHEAARACCPAPPSGKPVVNADQTVIILWDAAAKKEHFIRQASFKSDADDFGFLIPSPSQPELDESGNEAFGVLRKLTEPEIQKQPRPSGGIGCGCSAGPGGIKSAAPAVNVLEQKLVAGF